MPGRHTASGLRIAACAALLTMVVAGATPPARAADIIRVASNEWCPYNCGPADDRPGYMVDVLTEAFAAVGHRIAYETRPRNRALREARMGFLDAVVGAVPRGVERYVIPQTPLATVQPVLALRAQSRYRYDGPASLAPLLVGAVKGYNYTAEIDAYLAQAADDMTRTDLVFQHDAETLGLRKLTIGRIDAFLGYEAVLAYLAERLALSDRLRLVPVGEPTHLYIAFSPASADSPRYAALFDEGMRILADSGRLAVLRAKYGLSEEDRP